MGCDIHIILECKYEINGVPTWVGIQNYDSLPESLFESTGAANVSSFSNNLYFNLRDRNYDFFNDLCGTRGEGSEFGYEARGVPADASTMGLAFIRDNEDYHSHSWLSLEELRPILVKRFSAELVKARVIENKAEVDPVRLFVFDIDDADLSDYRVVFAFDN